MHTRNGTLALVWGQHADRPRKKNDSVYGSHTHYLPAYSPQDNPIERVWWHLHEQITRNHRCESIEELIKLTMAWLDEHGSFKIEGRMYERLRAAA